MGHIGDILTKSSIDLLCVLAQMARCQVSIASSSMLKPILRPAPVHFLVFRDVLIAISALQEKLKFQQNLMLIYVKISGRYSIDYGEIMSELIKKVIFRFLKAPKVIKNFDDEERALLIYFLNGKYKKRKVRIYKKAANRLINKSVLEIVESSVRPGVNLIKISDDYYSILKAKL